jgi:hypothetical protein
MDSMKQAVGLQFYFAAYDPRALPWAGMNQTFGLSVTAPRWFHTATD